MSRPPLGPALIDRLDGGSADARTRARLILETIAGQTAVEDAAAALGVSAQRFHELRSSALEQLVAGCEPKPLGRPAQPVDASADLARAHERQLADLRVENELLKARAELVACGLDRRLRRREKKRR
jgi:hypothetical protein